MATTPQRIDDAAQVKVLDIFTKVFNYMSSNEWGLRERLFERDLQFYRENDWDTAHARAAAANRAGDSRRLQNVQVPIVMPQVESQLADLVQIFLTGYPMFGVAAPPDQMDLAEQMETQIADNSLRFAWIRNFMLSLRDGLKYNLCATCVDWEVQKVGSVLSELGTGGDMDATAVRTDYAGNKVEHWSLYNTVLDPRVAPAKMHTEGEFAGHSELISRTTLKRRMTQLPRGTLLNATKAFESGLATISHSAGTNSFYIPQINNRPLIDARAQAQDWMTWLGMSDGKIRYSPSYEWSVLYVRMIPSEVGIKMQTAPNTPRVFKLIVINRAVLIYCQPQDTAHDFLPVFFGQPVDDALSYQTKSFAENAEPYQQIATALWASVIEGQRRQVYDRLLYDPDRVRASDINRADSVGRIPVRNKSYSKNVAEGVAALPYRAENQVGVLQLIQQIGMMADESNGTNRAARGQFQKGNRTRFEYEDIQSGTTGRTHLMALGLEASYFGPIKEAIKLNVLQYQTPADFINQRTGKIVAVSPEQLRRARISMKLSDGMLPSSKLMSSDLLQNVTQTVLAVPALQAEYDVMAMLTYNWRMSGASWLPDFKRGPDGRAAFLQTAREMAAVEQPEPGNPTQTPGASNGPAITQPVQ